MRSFAITDHVTIGAALLATIWVQRARPLVLACPRELWLVAVVVIKLTSLEALGG